MQKFRILGIDPGSIYCGYGVIEICGQKITLIELGTIKAKKKYELLNDRIKEIFLRINEVIKRTQPDETAIETMFYSKNVQSLMKLSHARAAAVLANSLQKIPISEYSPREIKKSVTGKGSATKEQVQFMVQKLLNINETPELYDVTDALAVAICHSFKRNINKNKVKTWNDFIKQNPDKVLKL